MSKLLVSVRDVAEADVALEAGVDLIDLKEPRRGSLGKVDDAVARDAVKLIARRVPLSLALGELADAIPAARRCAAVPAGVRYAKLGLAACAQRDDWRDELEAAVAELRAEVGFVAVCYADAELCGAPPIADVTATAIRCRAQAVLVDTAVKTAGDLLAWWSVERLTKFVAEIRSQGMLAVVGGGLTLESIPKVAACDADYIAVRGAACDGDRTGMISAKRIAEIRQLLIV